MKKIRLGKTELMVTRPALGCLPVQRCDNETAVKILRRAYESGINYFDTANSYTDSEFKIGLALSDVRENIVISTKSHAKTKDAILAHIENSLKMMRTDHIDLFQFHMADPMPDPDDPAGAYAGAVEAKERGWIDHIGITTHSIDVAEQSVRSGLFETLQFPFSYISSDRDIALAEKCREADMGFIAMKGLAGGLLTDVAACHAFMEQFDNVVPIWGVQTVDQVDDWVRAAEENLPMSEDLSAVIRKDRQELAGSFCRSCGYCMPCPAGIEIRNAARMDMLLRRSPWQPYMTAEWREKMDRINDCIECYSCASKCPYGLDTPKLLKYMLKDYDEFYESHKDLI